MQVRIEKLCKTKINIDKSYYDELYVAKKKEMFSTVLVETCHDLFFTYFCFFIKHAVLLNILCHPWVWNSSFYEKMEVAKNVK